MQIGFNYSLKTEELLSLLIKMSKQKALLEKHRKAAYSLSDTCFLAFVITNDLPQVSKAKTTFNLP